MNKDNDNNFANGTKLRKILINFRYLSLLKPNNFASTIFMFNVKFTYEYFRKWTRKVSLYYIWRN
ncbi:hypothetical protein HYE34_00685 [Mycoplasmopsis bovis]|nr:hypothetical protein HYE34_00685 [Mycoplasmopsis bovis]